MMEGSAAAQIQPAAGRSVRAVMRLLRDELTLTPDRWARMLRMTALVTIVVVVSNALRVPNLALSAYMIFFFSKSDVVATVRTGIAGVVGLTLVLMLAFVLYSVTFGEPALRLLAMGGAIFAGFYLVRSSPPLGPLGLLFGLAFGYSLALVDSVASPGMITRGGLRWFWSVSGEACRVASGALLADGPVLHDGLTNWERELAGRADLPAGVLAVVLPLLTCVRDIGSCLLELRDSPSGASGPKPGAEAAKAAPPNRTEAVQFALKVTLASMAAYILYTSLDWSGIHTAMLTCFLVALDGAGATIHRLTLRIAGALIGAALGIASIVFVLPQLETVGGLALLVAAVTLFAAWIATSRETISYAGWQIAFAFYLTVLQGFSRTSKMVVGRDRVIGILVGNLIMSLVFTTVWPVWSRTAIRRTLGRALQCLADALRLEPGRAVEAELAFRAELQEVKQSEVLEAFEG